MAYHSNYFQMLGDHGWPGLALYVVLVLAVWMQSARVRRAARSYNDLHWAVDLTSAIRVATLGYLVGGITISHAYYEPFYALIGLLTATQVVVRKRVRTEASERQGRRPEAAPMTA